MRVAGSVWLGTLLLAGCIPQSDPPPRYGAARDDADGAGPAWPYSHSRRHEPPRPPARDPSPPPDRDAAADANRRSSGDMVRGSDGPDTPPDRDAVPGRNAPPRPDRRADPAPYHRPAPDLHRPQSQSPRSALQRGPNDDDGSNARVPAPPRARPAWEARPVQGDGRVVADGSYTVRPGETLHAAGEATGVGAEALARANGLSTPDAVRAGQRLRIPGGRYHLVRPGQSGIAIARAYGVAWSRIVDANGLTEPYTLHVGQHVLIPDVPGRGSSAANRAAAFSLDVDDILTGGEPALAVDQTPAKPIATATRVLPPSAALLPPARLRGGFAWPADGKLVKRFGHGDSGYRNDGIEIAVPVETPVRAAADGIVAYAGEGIAALGGLVIVRHGEGWTTVYGHASKLLVQRGQSVRRGQTIALSGDTGFVDRPELHFELRKGRAPVDPLAQLPNR